MRLGGGGGGPARVVQVRCNRTWLPTWLTCGMKKKSISHMDVDGRCADES